MTVITNVIAVGIISQTNCQVTQVCSEPCVDLPTSPPSTSYDPGVWVTLSAVSVIPSHSPHPFKERNFVPYVLIFPDLCIRYLCLFCATVCTPRVGLPLFNRLPKTLLMSPAHQHCHLE